MRLRVVLVVVTDNAKGGIPCCWYNARNCGRLPLLCQSLPSHEHMAQYNRCTHNFEWDLLAHRKQPFLTKGKPVPMAFAISEVSMPHPKSLSWNLIKDFIDVVDSMQCILLQMASSFGSAVGVLRGACMGVTAETCVLKHPPTELGAVGGRPLVIVLIGSWVDWHWVSSHRCKVCDFLVQRLVACQRFQGHNSIPLPIIGATFTGVSLYPGAHWSGSTDVIICMDYLWS